MVRKRGPILLLALWALCLMVYRSPTTWSKTTDASLDLSQAWADLETLVAMGLDRAVGSSGHERTRHWLVRRLEETGVEAEVQSAEVCPPARPCSRVHNVVGWIPGRETHHAVLVSAHYDSVPGSPGAADNGAGVVIALELARVLRQASDPRNSVLLLFSDAEEQGLAGAEAFMRRHHLSPRVRAVVNLDARGSSGPSLMFETGPGNGALLKIWSPSVSRPVTSSLFDSLYRLSGSDTDFTVFRSHGLKGFNLAPVGDDEHYHRASDRPEHLSRETLRHHGQTALEAVVGLRETNLPLADSEDFVYFDLLSFKTISWPAAWMAPISVLNVLLLLALCWRVQRLGLYSLGGLTRAFLRGWCVPVAALAVVAGCLSMLISRSQLRSFGGLQVVPNSPDWLVVAAWLLPCLLFLWPRDRQENPAAWIATWLGVALLGAIIAWIAPEACYPLVLPAVLASVLGWLALVFSAPFWNSLARWLAPSLFGLLAFSPLYFTTLALAGSALPWVSMALCGVVRTFVVRPPGGSTQAEL